MEMMLDIDGELLDNAARLTGVTEKSLLVKLALEVLIAKESARRLAALEGTEEKLQEIRRRSIEE